VFISLIALDIFSHWFQMYASQLAGSSTHKVRRGAAGGSREAAGAVPCQLDGQLGSWDCTCAAASVRCDASSRGWWGSRPGRQAH
jgi:hypothetical protein